MPTVPNQLLLLLTASSLALTACGQQTASNQTTASTSGSLPPVETKEPNSAYKPAVPGQTRIAGVKTTTPYEGKVLTESLKNPWGITSLPDGRLLVTEREGTMRIVTTDGKVSDPITGLPTVNAKGQGGLLGVRVDPDFAKNRMVYWVFSEPLPEGNLTAVAKGTLATDEKTIQNPTVIYRATPAYKGTLHYGGRILIAPDGNLFISTGERSDLVTRPQAQSLNSGLG
ncbi:MAG: PQQ-dependent sugar dehydrogenase, partial [Cytophagaceae bacterium]